MATKSLLRFSTAGSVDDGKSTLIGRLLYDTKGAFDDQIEAVKQSKVNRSNGAIDFSLLTDGLRAEREQGITIDVAYRYFATPRRKFIIADTPGHEQYTRNMATGASTADVAVVLVDARKGVLDQSRRHAYIASLLGIRKLVVAVNKMDLVDYSVAACEGVRQEFARLAPRLAGAELTFIPVCATDGDNVTSRSLRMPWYEGPSLLEYLETVDVGDGRARAPLRFPVQYVLRPDHDFRGFAGHLAAGSVAVGDEVLVLPSARRTQVARIVTFDGDLNAAVAPQSVTLVLSGEIDLSRGGLIAAAARPPRSGRWVEAALVWMAEKPLTAGAPLTLRHGPHEVTARIDAVRSRVEMRTLEPVLATGLALNEIGTAVLETAQPLHFDAYSACPGTGAFILIDPVTNLTVAAGMLRGPAADPAMAVRAAKRVDFRTGRVTPAERAAWFGHTGALILADPHSALAHQLERDLNALGAHVVALEDAVTPLAPLLEAGLLVIAAEGEAEVMVPAADTATATLDELRARGVLRRANFTSGDGI